MHIGKKTEFDLVPDAEPSPWWAILLLLMAAGLRFYNLPENSVWFDEAVAIKHARVPFWEMIGWVPYDDNPPLHQIILFVSLRFFGITEFAARLPSALFDVGTVGLVFLLGRHLFGTLVGLIAACLVAFSPFHIIYAQEARMYASLAFFATLSVLTLVGYLERNTLRSRLSYVAATSLLLYTHYYALFVVAAENLFVLYLLFRYPDGLGKRLTNWILIQVAVFALFGLWIPTLLSRIANFQGGSCSSCWIQPPSLKTLGEVLQTIAGGQWPLIFGLIALTGIARNARFRGNESRASASASAPGYWDKVGLLALWFAMPVLVPFLLSFFIQPFFLSRYTIGASPAWQIAVALGLCNWCNARPLPAVAISALLLATIAPSIAIAYKPPWKSDWRDAVAYLDEHSPRHGQIYLPVWWERVPYLFYARRDDIEIITDERGTKARPDHSEIWVISARRESFCDDQVTPELGALVEKHHFFGIAVCRYQKEHE